MKIKLTLIALLFSMSVAGQTGTFKLDSASATSSYLPYSSSIYAIETPKLPRTVRAGLMIANKRMTGRPRICIGNVIINADYSNTFFDHKDRLIDKKRILWAYEIPIPKQPQSSQPSPSYPPH